MVYIIVISPGKIDTNYDNKNQHDDVNGDEISTVSQLDPVSQQMALKCPQSEQLDIHQNKRVLQVFVLPEDQYEHTQESSLSSFEATSAEWREDDFQEETYDGCKFKTVSIYKNILTTDIDITNCNGSSEKAVQTETDFVSHLNECKTEVTERGLQESKHEGGSSTSSDRPNNHDNSNDYCNSMMCNLDSNIVMEAFKDLYDFVANTSPSLIGTYSTWPEVTILSASDAETIMDGVLYSNKASAKAKSSAPKKSNHSDNTNKQNHDEPMNIDCSFDSETTSSSSCNTSSTTTTNSSPRSSTSCEDVTTHNPSHSNDLMYHGISVLSVPPQLRVLAGGDKITNNELERAFIDKEFACKDFFDRVDCHLTADVQ